MKRQGSALIAALLIAATPAAAATGPFFSLHNTNFIVLIAFLIFVGILLYAGVPGKLAGLLDRRAATIHAELEEARSLREERADDGDPGLNAVLDQIDLRASVELAKAEMRRQRG